MQAGIELSVYLMFGLAGIAHQALRETRLLVERLKGPTMLLSDHVSNLLDVHGRIPEDSEVILEAIDDALGWPLDRFRPPIMTVRNPRCRGGCSCRACVDGHIAVHRAVPYL